MEDISKDFNIAKKDGVQFFYDQTNVDEGMFTSTVVSMQEEVKLDKQEQSILVQKLANLTGTGDDNLSYKKIMDKLSKIQIEEVGTDRSQGRPINIVRDRMKNIEFVLKELYQYQNDKNSIEVSKEEYTGKISKLAEELDILKKVNIIELCRQTEENKINIKNNYKNEKNKKIDELNLEKNNLINKINENKLKNNQKNNIQKNKSNKKIKKYILILIFILIINILIFILNKNIIKNNLINIFNCFLIPIYLIIIFILEKINNKKIKNKINLENEKNNKENEELNNEINLINKQLEILEEEKNKEEKEIEKEQVEIDNKIEIELSKLKEEFKNKLDLNYYLDKIENENINNLINNTQENINKNKLELQAIKIKEENINSKLEEMVNLKEEYDNLSEELADLENRNNVINLTKEIITKAYTNMKNNITPKFTENLSNNIAEISKGKYTKVGINDENGLIVENEYGEYIPADLLSTGTIDQLYLSLRLSMIDDLSNEKMPIILDEALHIMMMTD